MKHPVASFILLVSLLPVITAAQTPQQTRPRRVGIDKDRVEEVSAGDVVRINTTLVTVPVSVLDRQGRFVYGLKREDFRLFEDGVEQSIVHFEPTEMPFTVALLLDTSASTQFDLGEIKDAAIAFARQLRPQDRVLVVTFNDEVELLIEATNDFNRISQVIETEVSSGQSTRLYDAVDLVIRKRLNKIQGRKAIVLFTDGVDTASYGATGHSTLREVEELDALIYPIQYDTREYVNSRRGKASVSLWPFPAMILGNPTGPGSTEADYKRADRYLHGLADNTGGRLYSANDPAQLAQAFTSIAEEIRRQYRLGYYPQSGGSGERHAIKVNVNRVDVAVRARNTYIQRASVK
jgi:VWFA-related protein